MKTAAKVAVAGVLQSFGVEAVGKGAQDPTLEQWWAKAAELRSGGLDRILEPAPWMRTITHAGGFHGPLELTTTSKYLDLFSQAQVSPEPAHESSDGHVERWLGPGSVAGFPSGDGALQLLNRWAEDVADEQLTSLREEVAMSFVGVERAHYNRLPVEVVVEWSHVLDLPFDNIAPEPPVD